METNKPLHPVATSIGPNQAIELYQAAVGAIRHSAEMKAFYAGLKTRAKASKVALVAVVRTRLVLANALVRNMKPYEDRTNSVCPKNACLPILTLTLSSPPRAKEWLTAGIVRNQVSTWIRHFDMRRPL